MIGVEPSEFVPGEQRRIDQPTVERHERQRLEAKHLARAAFDGRGRRHQHEVLQPDAVFALAIETGLVGEDHAWLELYRAVPRDALRRLMHRKVTAHAMARSMVEIEPGLP